MLFTFWVPKLACRAATALNGAEEDEDINNEVGEVDVPADLVAAPNFGDAPTHGPDEPLRLPAGGDGDGGAPAVYQLIVYSIRFKSRAWPVG